MIGLELVTAIALWCGNPGMEAVAIPATMSSPPRVEEVFHDPAPCRSRIWKCVDKVRHPHKVSIVRTDKSLCRQSVCPITSMDIAYDVKDEVTGKVEHCRCDSTDPVEVAVTGEDLERCFR